MMKQKIWNGIKYWSQVFLLPIYWFSFITPRNKTLWLLGSSFGNRFADNPKYLYLYLSQHQKDTVRAVWISHKKEIVVMLTENGYEAYLSKSCKGIWYCLRAGVYIFDNYSKDISFWLSGGAKKVNLWHGVGNKRINYDNKFDKIRHPKNRWEKFKTYLRRLSDEKPNHYILATSEVMAKIFASAFRTDMAHVMIEGYPRNDILLSDKIKNLYNEEDQRNTDFIQDCMEHGQKVLYYMPTFRQSELKFFEVMDLKAFNDFLTKRGYVFFTKLHPKSKLKERFEAIVFSNIRNISADVDPYCILKYADLLITDYSSIYSDFLMLNKPSVLFPYDYEEYSRDTRDCYFQYGDYMKDLKAYNMTELMDAIDQSFARDTCEAGRMEVRAWMFDTADGKACERLAEKILKIVNS
jgi:CDP-glycerol glycerophosphotransferase (TagB/SpsB family)